jgi:hypothetical protein
MFFAAAFVVIFGAVACGGGEEEAKDQKEQAEEQAKEQVEEAKEEVEKAKGAPTEGTEKQDTTPQVAGPVTKYEDLPEDVKAKLPEKEKQELQQELPEKAQ